MTRNPKMEPRMAPSASLLRGCELDPGVKIGRVGSTDGDAGVTGSFPSVTYVTSVVEGLTITWVTIILTAGVWWS